MRHPPAALSSAGGCTRMRQEVATKLHPSDHRLSTESGQTTKWKSMEGPESIISAATSGTLLYFIRRIGCRCVCEMAGKMQLYDTCDAPKILNIHGNRRRRQPPHFSSGQCFDRCGWRPICSACVTRLFTGDESTVISR